MSDANSFCFYCQRQYATVGRLHAHIKRYHPGTYAATRVATPDTDETEATDPTEDPPFNTCPECGWLLTPRHICPPEWTT